MMNNKTCSTGTPNLLIILTLFRSVSL